METRAGRPGTGQSVRNACRFHSDEIPPLHILGNCGDFNHSPDHAYPAKGKEADQGNHELEPAPHVVTGIEVVDTQESKENAQDDKNFAGLWSSWCDVRGSR